MPEGGNSEYRIQYSGASRLRELLGGLGAGADTQGLAGYDACLSLSVLATDDAKHARFAKLTK